MKKSTAILLIIAAILLLLFLPIPRGTLCDGGTRVYAALTYKIIVWNRIQAEPDGAGDPGFYHNTSVFFFPENRLNIDELWEIEQDREGDPLPTLSAFLDREGFLPGIDQRTFREQTLNRYSYKGELIYELASVSHTDGDDFFSMSGAYREPDGNKELFEFFNSYFDGEKTSLLSTSVPLGGLKLPFRIGFDDTLYKVLRKMGIAETAGDDFPGRERDGNVLLLEDDCRTLALCDYAKYPETDDFSERYALHYTETTRVDDEKGARTVVRSIFIVFTDTESGIDQIRISIKEIPDVPPYPI